MTRGLSFTASVILALGSSARAQPPAGDPGYSQGYDDGYAACSAGGAESPAPGPRPYRQGYADGYRDCTLGPQGTLNSAGPPAAPPANQAVIDWRGWHLLGANVLQQPSEKLMIGADAGRFSQVRIAGTRGAPFIQAVHVRLVNDQLRSFEVHRRLLPGETLDLNLGGRVKVSSVTVTGRPDPQAAYQVAAR